MSTYELKLFREEVAAGARVESLKSSAVVARYVVSGSVRVHGAALAATFSANSAFSGSAPVEIAGGSVAATLLRWELAPAGAAASVGPSQGVESTFLLAGNFTLDQGGEYLLRCDRVDFPPGGVALLHTHQGGGIRCLLKGDIEIQTLGHAHSYRPLEAWFEGGPDPVFAAASKSEPSAFARVMILPRRLLGKSSIAYVNAEDMAKPKNQQYQVFIDTPIALPTAKEESR